MADTGKGTNSAGRAVWLVAKRELNARLRTKSFVWGTAAIIAVIAGYIALQTVLFAGEDTDSVGLQGQATSIAETLEASGEALGMTIETSTVTSDGQARNALSDGELDAVVSGNPAEPQVLVESTLDDELRAALNGVAQQQVLTAHLAQAGVDDPGAVLADANSATVEVNTIAADDGEKGQRLAVGIMMVFLLFMAISTYGALVAQGVIEEKSSRVVEILLATVRPWHLLLGKIIGLGLVGLAQMVIIAGVGIVLATQADVLTVSGVAVSTLLWGIGWYLLGFFLYATIYAGAGSLVSRQEDAQSVLTPVTMVLVIGFVVGMNLMLQAPDGTATRVLSLVPFLSPVLMPGRIAAGDVAAGEVAISIALTLATVAALTWLGSKVYQNAVLRTGSRIKLSEVLRG